MIFGFRLSRRRHENKSLMSVLCDWEIAIDAPPACFSLHFQNIISIDFPRCNLAIEGGTGNFVLFYFFVFGQSKSKRENCSRTHSWRGPHRTLSKRTASETMHRTFPSLRWHHTIKSSRCRWFIFTYGGRITECTHTQPHMAKHRQLIPLWAI